MSEYIIRERLELNFAQVPKTALKDKNLSLKAKGLYSYLFSLPEDWKVYKTEIVKNCSDGKDSMNAAFKELEKYGYLSSTPIRDPETKQFKGMILTLRIEPLRISRDGEPGNGFPGNGKPASNNTDSTNTSLFNNNDSDIMKKFKIPNIEEVQEYFRLLKKDDDAVKFYNFYKSKGWMVGRNKMKDWQAAAQNFVRDDNKKDKKTKAINGVADMINNFADI